MEVFLKQKCKYSCLFVCVYLIVNCVFLCCCAYAIEQLLISIAMCLSLMLINLSHRSSSDLRRRHDREARRDRINDKIRDIKDQMKESEKDFESDWSVPWLLVGFVAVLGYCVFYVLH